MTEPAQSVFSTKLWQPGDSEPPTLFERYQILGILGQGGMGTVFKGYHINLKRFVAIKTLRIDQSKSPDLMSRFLREMELVGQMDHPNVVRATDAGEKNGIFYLVMEYLTGADLFRLIAQRGVLKLSEACELTRQAALGLDYIHRKLIHRDIKPSNLMLTTAGLVKIVDLGLARCRFSEPGDRERTPQGCALGTFSYMAPEQAQGNAAIDSRADIYSLGCTLFKLLTGHAPFSGPMYDSAAKQIYAHAHVQVTAVESFHTLPEAIQPVLLRMVAKDPDRRYSSGTEAAQALLPFIDAGQPLQRLELSQSDADDHVRPLPQPLPVELSRLNDSPLETPRQTHTASTAFATPKPKRSVIRFGVLVSAGMLAVALGLAWLLLPQPREPREDPPPVGPPEAPVARPNPPPPEPSVFSLPLPPIPLRSLDLLKPVIYHDLLKQPEFPPDVVGFRKEDGLASGRWLPGEEKLELNPTSLILVQLASTSKQKPGFTFQTRLAQRPWNGYVGLFWGYQEDALVKAARKPGQPFGKFQLLHLTYTRNKEGGLQFYIARARATIQFRQDGGTALARQSNIARHDLPGIADEKYFMIDIRNGNLANAHFGATELTNLCTRDVNMQFQPADYQGSFGVYTNAANVTIRTPSALPHADN